MAADDESMELGGTLSLDDLGGIEDLDMLLAPVDNAGTDDNAAFIGYATPKPERSTSTGSAALSLGGTDDFLGSLLDDVGASTGSQGGYLGGSGSSLFLPAQPAQQQPQQQQQQQQQQPAQPETFLFDFGAPQSSSNTSAGSVLPAGAADPSAFVGWQAPAQTTPTVGRKSVRRQRSGGGAGAGAGAISGRSGTVTLGYEPSGQGSGATPATTATAIAAPVVPNAAAAARVAGLTSMTDLPPVQGHVKKRARTRYATVRNPKTAAAGSSTTSSAAKKGQEAAEEVDALLGAATSRKDRKNLREKKRRLDINTSLARLGELLDVNSGRNKLDKVSVLQTAIATIKHLRASNAELRLQLASVSPGGSAAGTPQAPHVHPQPPGRGASDFDMED